MSDAQAEKVIELITELVAVSKEIRSELEAVTANLNSIEQTLIHKPKAEG